MRSALENGGFSRSAFSSHHSAEAASRPCCSVWAVKCKSQPRRAGLRGKGVLDGFQGLEHRGKTYFFVTHSRFSPRVSAIWEANDGEEVGAPWWGSH